MTPNRPARPPHPLARLWPLAAALLLAACSTPPVTRLHSLLPSQALAGAAPAGPPLAVALAPVAVPAAVDQAPWLVRLPDDTLLMLEQDRWASPLREELRTALREVLAQRWGAVEAPGRAPDWRVAVELTRFESVIGREARIEGRWTLAGGAPGAAAVLACPVQLREPVGSGTPAMGDAHRRLVGRLGDQIGRGLRSAAGGTPACPPAAP